MTSGIDWENEVANYLETRSFRTNVRKSMAGHEVDVFAQKEGESLAVECKDWNTPVTPDPIRRSQTVAEELGATPGIAFTSQLAPGALELARRWGFVILSDEIVRGQILTIDDVERAVEAHEICLHNVDDLSDMHGPFDPFRQSGDFAHAVVNAARKLTFETFEDDGQWLQKRIDDICNQHIGEVCVPIFREDKGRLDLYFIASSEHDALPDLVSKSGLKLH